MIKFLKWIGRYLIYAEVFVFCVFVNFRIATAITMSPKLDHERGLTFYVRLSGAGDQYPNIGYIKPWIGYIYDTALAATYLLLALIAIWAIVYFSVVPRDHWRLNSRPADEETP